MTASQSTSRAPRRAAFAIVDAGLSSVGNFAFSWVGAIFLSLADFGVLSLLMVIGLLFQALVKSLIVDAYTLGYAGEDPASQKAAGAEALGAVLLVAVTGSGVALAGWALIGGEAGWAALAVAGIPLALHDAARWLAFAQGRVRLAASGTAVWTVLSACAVGLLLLSGTFSAATAVLCWGLTCSVSATLMIWQLDVRPRPRAASAWLRQHHGVGMKSSADFALTQSVAYGGGILVSLVAGPAGFGLLRLAQLPLAGIQILITGSISAIQPALVRRVRSGGAVSAHRMALTVAGALVLATMLCSAAIVVLPERLWTSVLGTAWPDAVHLVPILAVGLLGSAMASCAGPFLRAVGLLHREVVTKSVLTPLTMLGIAVGVTTGGVSGAAIAMSLGALVTGCVLTLLARRGARVYSQGLIS